MPCKSLSVFCEAASLLTAYSPVSGPLALHTVCLECIIHPCHTGSPRILKLRSHMRRAVADRRWADFDTSALLPQVRSHIRRVDAGGSAISWGQRWFGARGFEADAKNWVLDPFVAERILLSLRLRSATTHVWIHAMICVEANFPPASARVCSAHVWTYLKICWAVISVVAWWWICVTWLTSSYMSYIWQVFSVLILHIPNTIFNQIQR